MVGHPAKRLKAAAEAAALEARSKEMAARGWPVVPRADFVSEDAYKRFLGELMPRIMGQDQRIVDLTEKTFALFERGDVREEDNKMLQILLKERQHMLNRQFGLPKARAAVESSVVEVVVDVADLLRQEREGLSPPSGGDVVEGFEVGDA